MAIECDKWLYVKTESVESARRFFEVPADWPAEFDRFEDDPAKTPGRIFRVLSRLWVQAQNERHK